MENTERSQTGTEVAVEQVLGVDFFNGNAADAVERTRLGGGLLVAPASPALLNLKYDEAYRRALQQADVVLADSALLTRLWKLRTGRALHKISGLSYLKALLASGDIRDGRDAFFIVRSDEAKQKAIAHFERTGLSLGAEAFQVAKGQGSEGEDHALLLHLEERRPRHVIIAQRSGAQEKLGLYLREYLLYRPSIHCVGAALGFLTGDEEAIPEWAQRRELGWAARLISQPRMVIPRLGIAVAVAGMVFKYGSELPKLRPRWADL